MSRFPSRRLPAGSSDGDEERAASLERTPADQKSTAVWKIVGFVLFGVLVLIVTNMTEFRQTGLTVDKGYGSVASVTHKTRAKPIEVLTDRFTYQRRGQPMEDSARQAMEDKWGTWTLVDSTNRPMDDFYAKYPTRDVPRQQFPSNAWQTDTGYLAEFLPEALKLVERAQEAILAEYGQTEGSFEDRSEMFAMETFGTLEGTGPYIITKGEAGWRKDSSGERGGWTTTQSFHGLKRRLLHAVMTEDSFIVALGGHSAAAGHGNHFEQSAALQVGWILEPVFARLGVRHESKNFANGGLGTIQHGLAAASVYGPSIDMLWWDSGMTEGDAPSIEIFGRQGILGGIKVPVLWGLQSGVAKNLNLNADVDVGTPGRATFGIKLAESLQDIEAMPWATRYMKCGGDVNEICKNNKYIGHCWNESRTDVIPPTKQAGAPGGRAGWHPGNRVHQLVGRTVAFTILSALKEALSEWSGADGYELPDDAWHVTAYYENIREKVKTLDPEISSCKDFAVHDLEWVCSVPVKGRTEFTPRAYPTLSSIRSLMPPAMAQTIPESERPLYSPPEQLNPDLHPPPGAIDVLNILEAGVDFKSVLNPEYASSYYKKPTFANPPKMPFGKGVGLSTKAGDEFCDGTIYSFCDKGSSNNCLLLDHNDGRGGLVVDGFSGWTVMNIPDLLYGYIALKFETWHQSGENGRTADWTTENNMTSDVRRLAGPPPPDYCDDFQFEFAIDGEVTSWSKDEFRERLKEVQRVVETVTILKDPNFTGGVEKEVEVAFRLTGCARVKTFFFSHIYWA